MQQTEAYDLSAFAARQPKRKPALHLAPPVKKQRGLSRYGLRVVKIIALTTLFLSLVCSVLYSQSMLTELTGNIDRLQSDLVELKSEYAYLNNEMEMKTNLTEVETYAASRLGLVKLDQSQITYVQRDTESSVERTDSLWEGMEKKVQSGWLSFMSYLS